MAPRDYAYLLGLSALWGSSYLFIKIAVDGYLSPPELILLRLLIATIVLYLVVRWRGQRLPRERRVWRSFAVMGLVGAAMPFLLIAWGETMMDSSLAAILNATVPIMTVLLAHVLTRTERLTPTRLLGVLLGFVGVLVLVAGPSARGHAAQWPGVVALLVASLCYAFVAIFARSNLRDVPPELASTGQMFFGAIFLAVPGAVATVTARHAPEMGALAAMLALALLGTVGAYLLYYRLIARVGATRTTMSTYLLPVFAVVYGALFLHEPVGPRLLLGFALILLGVAVVNGLLRARWAIPRQAVGGPTG